MKTHILFVIKGEEGTFLVSILFVLQAFFFSILSLRSKYQLYAKWPTFGFYPLEMGKIHIGIPISRIKPYRA